MVSDHDAPYIEVLRLGHRPERDKRITTHVSLVARALGARGIHIDRNDSKLEETIQRVNDQFGGDFFIRTGVSRKGLMGRWNGTIVHLTMYGMPLDDAVKEIPKSEDLLVVVGAEKVPRDVYDISHYNVSVASQPHSEVSALALFLDRMFDGKELTLEVPGGNMKIEPNRFGKTVRSPDDKKAVKDPFSTTWPPIPSAEECIVLLTSVGCSQPVISHVRAVRDMGLEMVRSIDLNEEDSKVLEAGLLLHDIGRSVTHSLKHITYGVKIAKRIGLDDRIIGMVHNHIGAGVTSMEARELGLPQEDHIPSTLLERIVCHADNLVGERKRRGLAEAMKRLEDKGALEAALRMKELHEGLEKELSIDIDELV